MPPFRKFRKSRASDHEHFQGKHRFEHWYCDNQVYFIPFWRDEGDKDYFDGCIRDEVQCRRAYRYTYTQSRRHGVCPDPAQYPHTRVNVKIDAAVKRAIDLGASLESVPYKRYER